MTTRLVRKLQIADMERAWERSDSSQDRLLAALAATQADGLPRALVIQGVRVRFEHDARTQEPSGAGAVSGIALLTSRERQVARLAAMGARNREIADDLHISEETVKRHLYNTFSKLGMENRTQLAFYLTAAEHHPSVN